MLANWFALRAVDHVCGLGVRVFDTLRVGECICVVQTHQDGTVLCLMGWQLY